MAVSPSVDVPVIDTHVHVACGDTVAHPLRPTGVGSAWWSQQDGTAAAVFAAARSVGVDRVVVVQAVGAYGYDASCAAASVAASSGFATLVAAPDMSRPDPCASIGAILESPHLRGLRLFGVADGAPWLDDARGDSVMACCADRGLVAVPTIFSDRVPSLRGLMARHPDVVVALDHCAFPDMAGEAGERALFSLADVAGLHLKVSSHVLAAWQSEGRLGEVFGRLVDAFGASRMCWGSDHPQHEGLDYAGKLALARLAAAHLVDADREMFFAGTARRLGWG
ncbi:MAG: amidohydrolase [Acidimicrobiales bacterium]|nr:amidohydrolase [Acidimicrobiales bacterium]